MEEENDEENLAAFERIKTLIVKTTEMKREVPARRESVQDTFKLLRDRISNSTHYLTKIKHDIENIKLALNEDRSKTIDVNDTDYLEMCSKTDEEIDEEFRKVHCKLDELQKRVSNSKEKLLKDNKTFQQTLSETVNTLDNVGKGILNFSEID